MDHFQWQFPCDPSELVHFRKRIGESGVEKIFQASVVLHGKQALEREVVIDTTVQEKNITFPTDAKLRVKVIGGCWKLASKEKIRLRRSGSPAGIAVTQKHGILQTQSPKKLWSP